MKWVLRKGSRVTLLAKPVLEEFAQWLPCTNTGLAAKVCLDVGAALMKGVSVKAILASFRGTQVWDPLFP